jgi:hypothetical protein
MVPRVTPALPFLLVLGDGIRKARASQRRHAPGNRLDREPGRGAPAIGFTPSAEPDEAATYVFTPANHAA